MNLKIDNIKLKKIPNHIAFILDGNRRWAKSQGLSINEGHKKGFEKIEELCDWCLKYEVKYLTLYCLSTENLKRDKEELDFLFKDLKKHINNKNIEKYKKKGIEVKIIGDFSKLPSDIEEELIKSNQEKYSKKDIKLNLQLCISYGGRQEIVDVVKKISNKVKNGEIDIDKINEETINQNLYYNIPEPDLLIRTGGEQRLSNFLLWQLSYSELYFCEKMLPAFEEQDFLLALYFFQDKDRRYGR